MRLNGINDVNQLAAFRELDGRLSRAEALLSQLATPNKTKDELDKLRKDVARFVRRPNTLDFNDVFRGAGPAHAIGHVPDAGLFEEAGGFLAADGTWKQPFGGIIE